MIKNDRQYKIAKNNARRFAEALEEFEAKADERPGVHPRLVQAEKDALKAQWTMLLDEIKEYEQLRRKGVSGIVVTSIDELPKWLIKARIASGLTQRELADRLHLKTQQIQRYEAEGYASANYQRLCEVAHALGVGAQTRLSVR